MSRIGKNPITLPSGVSVQVDQGSVKVSGTKGVLEQPLLPGLNIDKKEGQVTVNRTDDEPTSRARHGLMRSLIDNMVIGVSEGFEKKLEINGVGYRVQAQGDQLKFNLGFSHEVVYKVPAGVNVTIDSNQITVSGIDKQKVGQVAAEIRALKKPEPYKGKGIKYIDERILRKSGKSGKEAT
ncbi:MAG: 50S ribosomal protein L6 [Candidatus Saccharimonadales bacterium]